MNEENLSASENADIKLEGDKTLEDIFPKSDRRAQGYKLVGFEEQNQYNKQPRNIYYYPNGKVPIYYNMKLHLKTGKYDSEELRQLRGERGVGKIKKTT